MDVILFKHANEFVKSMQKISAKSIEKEGIFINNINPMMVGLLILDLLMRIVRDFPLLKLTIEKICEELSNNLLLVIEDFDPQKFQKLLLEKSSSGFTCLDIAQDLDKY